MSFANFNISFSDEFEVARIALFCFIGVFAIPIDFLCMFFVIKQSSSLSSEYILQLTYDIQICFLFIVCPLVPCTGIFMKGAGIFLGISAHTALVMNLTNLSAICAWFNCCLFHRHQVILHFDHPLKLQQHGIYCVYCIMNVVMIVNPISFLFSTKNDQNEQRAAVASSPMSWLLEVPSYKIYTDRNCPLVMIFHFLLALVTFALCTITTTALTHHATKVMNARRNQISAATIVLQQRLIINLQFQMNATTFGCGFPAAYWAACIIVGFTTPGLTCGMMLVLPIVSLCNSVHSIISTKSSVDFMLGVLRIRKLTIVVKPHQSMTAFPEAPLDR